MKSLSVIFIAILLFIYCSKLYAEDALTTKQQLDRIIEEVKDLNKAVFNKSFDKNEIYLTEDNNDAEKFSSIDLRIYELEKNIRNLTFQFEEMLFKLDDITNKLNLVETELITKIEQLTYVGKDTKIEIETDENQVVITDTDEEQSLGKLIISNNDNDENLKDLDSEIFIEENIINKQEQKLDNLSPEEVLQFALNQMLKKNYDNSKKILEDFVIDYPENQLSGSAHFWLGKIYLFESNYRKAAIVFGEGVQKFPKSIKAAEMYYELSKSLKEMNKVSEACKTLVLLEENYKGNKFTKDPEKIKDKLNCGKID